MPTKQVELRYSGSLELRSADGQPPKIVGYAAVFNRDSEDLGGFVEQIAPGAFADSLATSPDVRALVNHDPSPVLGRTSAGTLSLFEDEHGLRAEIVPPDTTAAKDVLESIRRGDISQMSFAFVNQSDAWDESAKPKRRTIRKADLVDVSVVTFPAYPDTEVAVRSLAAWRGKMADENKTPTVEPGAGETAAKARVDATVEARRVERIATEEKRELTADEKARIDELYARIDAIDALLAPTRSEDDEEVEEEVDAERVARPTAETRSNTKTYSYAAGRQVPPQTRSTAKTVDVRTKAINTVLRHGMQALAGTEYRALAADNSIQGGYLVMPQEWVNQLIKGIDNRVVMRSVSTTYPVGMAQSLGVPTLDANPADPTWTTELLTGSADSTMTFGKRELTPNPLAIRLLVSQKFMDKSLISPDALVRDRLGYKCGTVEENAFLNGSGSLQPLGVFTASAMGVTTARDVSTDNTTTAITCDGLINCKYSLNSGYLSSPSLRWIFHRDAIKMIRKLKDGNGQYIWTPGINATFGDSILDVPVLMSEYAPNTFTTGSYVGIIGDFSYYWIVDGMNLQIKVLNELYAETNQIGYVARLECDGMPVLAEAFARVKLA